jgi:FtsP/CotA-like multicopper oxidase with cupredoxin domain
VRQGDIIEWVVVNAEGYAQHPFHMHTNHFQIVDMSHGEGIDYDIGDWRDTITLPTPGNVTIRFVAADYHGRSLAHCHVFAHADTGMAHEVHILPP